MSGIRAPRSWRGPALVLTLLLAPAVHVKGESAGADPQTGPDFLFGAPKGSVGVRGGWSFSRTDSDIYDFVRDQLTVEKSDFNAPLLVLDLTLSVTPRLAGMFRFEYSRAAVDSEFRDFVDQDDLPITQSTELTKIPLTGTLKLYLTPRGREISRYAWVPHSFAPYLGGGGGLLWYRFRQAGDFVDFADWSIFRDTFRSDGWTTTFHVLGGIEVKLGRRLFVTMETCYAWGDARLGQDFVGFDPMDLSGLKTTVGIEFMLN